MMFIINWDVGRLLIRHISGPIVPLMYHRHSRKCSCADVLPY